MGFELGKTLVNGERERERERERVCGLCGQYRLCTVLLNFRLLLMHSDVIFFLEPNPLSKKVDKHQIYQYYTFVQIHVIIIMIFS